MKHLAVLFICIFIFGRPAQAMKYKSDAGDELEVRKVYPSANLPSDLWGRYLVQNMVLLRTTSPQRWGYELYCYTAGETKDSTHLMCFYERYRGFYVHMFDLEVDEGKNGYKLSKLNPKYWPGRLATIKKPIEFNVDCSDAWMLAFNQKHNLL